MSKHIDLYPANSDPFGRSGVTIDGVYTPFKYGYVDSNGNWVIEPQFDEAEEFYQGNAPITLNGKYGRLLPDGTYLIRPEYDAIWGFTERFAIVKKNGKWGFIKDDGSILVPPKFDRAFEFEKGYAFVTLNGKNGYIDTTGQWYDQIPNSRGYDESIIPDQVSSVDSDINSTEKIIDWEERHFQICLALLSGSQLKDCGGVYNLGQMPHKVIETADKIVELLKDRHK